MKIEKTIKMSKSYEMDGTTILSDNDTFTFTYDDDPNKFLNEYNKVIEEYYDGDEEAYSKNDFFDDNWSEFINFEYYYEIDDYEDLLDYVVDYYKKNVIKDILEELKTSGHKLGIITSNSTKNVSDFLKRNEIESYFSYIRTKVAIFGKKKALIKAKKILKTNFLYVGDEIRDIEACKKSNTPIVCVSWGLNSAQGLESHNPGLVANTPEQALSLIKNSIQKMQM